MMAREEGMVLLVTIMMMTILTLLVLTLLQAVFLYVKIDHKVLQSHQDFHQLEAVARRLMQGEVGPAACLLNNETPNMMIQLLLNNRGCSLIDERRTYYYWFDDLGLFPCLKIRSAHTLNSSHHWLITMSSVNPRSSILQLRFVTPAPAIACDSDVREIKAGVTSWRYLPYNMGFKRH